MALRIPILDSQQVQAQGLPTPQIRGNAPNGLAAVGQGLQQAAGVAQQIATKKRDEAEQYVLMEAEKDFREHMLRLKEAQQDVGGSNITDPKSWGGQEGEAYSTYIERSLEEKLNGLTAKMRPELATRFRAGVNPSAQTFASGARLHERAQFEAKQDGIFNANMATLDEQAVKSVDEKTGSLNAEMLEDALRFGQGAIEAHGSSKAMTPEKRAEIQRKWQSETIGKVLTRLQGKHNSTEAKALLEKYKDTLTPEDYEKHSKAIQVVNDKNLGFTLAREALTKFGSEQNQTFDLVAATDWIKSQTGENASAFDHAQSELSFLANAAKQTWNARENAVVDSIYAASTKNTSPSVIRGMISDALSNGRITGKVAASLERDFRSYWKAQSSEAKQDQREAQMMNLAVLNMNPGVLQGKTQAEVLGMVRDLGPAGLHAAVDLWKQVNFPQDPKRSSASIDQNDFMVVAAEAGLVANGKVTEPEAVNKLRSLTELQILELSKKGPVDEPTKLKVLRTMATKVKLEGLGFFGGSKERLLFQVTESDLDTHIKKAAGKFGVNEDDAMVLKFYLLGRGLTTGHLATMTEAQWKAAKDEFIKNTGGRK